MNMLKMKNVQAIYVCLVQKTARDPGKTNNTISLFSTNLSIYYINEMQM